MIPAPEDAGTPAGATTTASGLAFKILEGGNGKQPGSDKVTVHYTGWTAATGDMFDSSVLRAPATFVLNQVIRGWIEGLQHMQVGQKARFWIPAPGLRRHPAGWSSLRHARVRRRAAVVWSRLPLPVPEDVAPRLPMPRPPRRASPTRCCPRVPAPAIPVRAAP